MDYRVYVTLGFHINFYHSWRGDSPDEAGFGTDIRVIRELLRMLNEANDAGLDARGYWDTEVYWTFQEILPRHSPDILDGIRKRVESGLDEIVLGPYNNGANHAATREEFHASVAWAIENEWGSGLKQLFGKTAPLYRPQEAMFTVGQEEIFRECGVDGLILYYAAVPFNSISSFIPVLPDEERYNPMWFRGGEKQPRMVLMPCIAAGDLIEEVSFENLMLRLHRAQQRGDIESDVLIHINEDADLETWLPTISWMPNMGGLGEFIRAVNRYPWAEFTLPSEYLASHPPKADLLVRQDLADGAYDGNYSWAEKASSMRAWTVLEQSRMASFRAENLASRTGVDLSGILWDGMDSSFFQRLIGLSTTHFGMSTPIINEERQNRAFEILGRSLDLAEDGLNQAVSACRKPGCDALYDFELVQTPPEKGVKPAPARIPVHIPVVLPPGVHGLRVEDDKGKPVQASLTDIEPLPEDRCSARIRLAADFRSSQSLRLRVFPAEVNAAQETVALENEWIRVRFSELCGIEQFRFRDWQIGGSGFLSPFVTYGNRTWSAETWELLPLQGETGEGLQRVRLQAGIPMQTAHGEYSSEFTYTFSLFDDLPYLLVDVRAAFAYTPPKQVIHNLTQKLRRLMDLHWIETAPFQLIPDFEAAAGKPLRVWKHNYLGITSYFDLDYGDFNPKNSSLDAFNHQVTAGWVAVSSGDKGLLIGEDASSMASMAFCPMRLREESGVQKAALNPFGSYYGEQLDYSQMGGNGNGTDIIKAFSGALHPNGPSFNGETLEFSLFLAPYMGDEPPRQIQNDAASHFYPPAVLVHSSPDWLDALTGEDIERMAASENHRARLTAGGPLDPPGAFLANPSSEAVDLVWDPPRTGPVTGYEIHWRVEGDSNWRTALIPECTRWRIDGLQDGDPLWFRMRSMRGDEASSWTAEAACIPGAVTDSSVGSMLGGIPPLTLVKVILSGLAAVVRGWFAG